MQDMTTFTCRISSWMLLVYRLPITAARSMECSWGLLRFYVCLPLNSHGINGGLWPHINTSRSVDDLKTRNETVRNGQVLALEPFLPEAFAKSEFFSNFAKSVRDFLAWPRCKHFTVLEHLNQFEVHDFLYPHCHKPWLEPHVNLWKITFHCHVRVPAFSHYLFLMKTTVSVKTSHSLNRSAMVQKPRVRLSAFFVDLKNFHQHPFQSK